MDRVMDVEVDGRRTGSAPLIVERRADDRLLAEIEPVGAVAPPTCNKIAALVEVVVHVLIPVPVPTLLDRV